MRAKGLDSFSSTLKHLIMEINMALIFFITLFLWLAGVCPGWVVLIFLILAYVEA